MKLIFAVFKATGAISALRGAKRYARIQRILWLMVWCSVLLFVWLAYQAKEDAFEQYLFIELFGGVATFAIAPIFLRIASRSTVLIPVVALAVAMGIGYCAYRTHGIWQHILLELSVAVALLAGLDQLLKATLRYLERRKHALSDNVKAWMALDWMEFYKSMRAQTPDTAPKIS